MNTRFRELCYGDDYATQMLEAGTAIRNPQKEMASIKRYFQKNYLPYLPADKQARILDVACGRGLYQKACKSFGYENVSGVDLSDSNVALCQSEELNVIKADGATYLKEHPAAFECIIFNDCIEHLYKDEIVEMLEAMLAALTENGVLLVKTLNAANPYVASSGRYIDFTHEQCFTELSLSQIMHACGFRNITVRGCDIYTALGPIGLLPKAVAKIACLFMRFWTVLFGRTSIHIFEKLIIAVGHKTREDLHNA